MPDVDAPIVQEVLSGNRDAFASLVDRHESRVFAILMRLVADPDEAAELAQETFVRAYRALGGFRAEARFGTWIVQIAVHLVRDRNRQRQRRSVVSLDAYRERQADDDPLTERRATFDPRFEVDERELCERLEEELALLPPSYREVFVLRQVEGLPYEEISAMTGDSIGSLKVRAHRARTLLKETLLGDPDPTLERHRDGGR